MSTSPAIDHAFRRSGLGASEVAAAIGVSQYQSPLDVWMLKTGKVEPVETSDAMRWGSMLEPVILAWYEQQHGVPVTCRQERIHIKGSPIWATLDGIAKRDDGPRIVEAKSAGWSRGWGDAGTDKIPPHYLIQVQVQMRAVEFPLADVIATVGGRPPQTWTVKADGELQQMVIDRAGAFWRLVESDTPPDPTTGADLRRLMDVLHPVDTQQMKLATATVERLADELRQQQRVQRQADELVEWTVGRIKREIGDAAGVEGNFGKMTWKANKNGSRVFRCAWAETESGHEV